MPQRIKPVLAPSQINFSRISVQCSRGVEHLLQRISARFITINDKVLHDKTIVMEDTGSESTAQPGILPRSSSSGSSSVELTDTDHDTEYRPCVSEQLQETPVIPTVQMTKMLVRSNSLDQLRSDTEAIKAAFRSNVRTKQEVSRSMPEVFLIKKR